LGLKELAQERRENMTHKPDAVELLPCPFCGNDEIQRYNYEPNKWRITCRDCRNTTKDWPTVDDATERWNTRDTAELKQLREFVGAIKYVGIDGHSGAWDGKFFEMYHDGLLMAFGTDPFDAWRKMNAGEGE
jgi:hypothetical protein